MSAVLCLALLVLGQAAPAQEKPGPRAPSNAHADDAFDPIFRKYSKRFFGPTYDWRTFKAQGMAESDLRPWATSRVGAKGIMQLMPSTFAEIQSKNPELKSIDHPEWNIAAGIQYDSRLWRAWKEHTSDLERRTFMFGSYNAGRGTILRAQSVARQRELDHLAWQSIESVAPEVPRWRHRETLDYVRKIDKEMARMDSAGKRRGVEKAKRR